MIADSRATGWIDRRGGDTNPTQGYWDSGVRLKACARMKFIESAKEKIQRKRRREPSGLGDACTSFLSCGIHRGGTQKY